jgi:hypothetical protein
MSMTQEELEKKLKELRKEWRDKPKLRGIIERRARCLQIALDSLKQKYE